MGKKKRAEIERAKDNSAQLVAKITIRLLGVAKLAFLKSLL